MKHRVGLGLVLSGLLALPGVPVIAQDDTAEEPQSPEFFFVLSSASGSFDAETLTLDDVANVFYFSDRPERIAGSAPLDLASRIFTDGHPFTGLPPNAVLSILDGGTPEIIALELTSAEIDGTTIRMGYEPLDGPPGAGAFGSATLFVDSTALGGNWHFDDPFGLAET